jgi:NADH-quinone oxidoreductase subunit F
MEQGLAEERDLDTLKFQTKFMAPGNTFCAFAPGAVEPLQSALKYFAGDFTRHITEKRCPWR